MSIALCRSLRGSINRKEKGSDQQRAYRRDAEQEDEFEFAQGIRSRKMRRAVKCRATLMAMQITAAAATPRRGWPVIEPKA